MNREYHRWYSWRLNQDMELLVYGHAGAKVLVFPSREGRFYEYENLGMVAQLQDKIEAGHLQLYCVDNIYFDSLYGFHHHPAHRIWRQQQFEEYILNEVMPLMAGKNDHPCTIAHGCSLGAFQAANIAFRHPHLFRKLCAFSGRYDLTEQVESFSDLFHGYYDQNIYYHSPTRFLPGLLCGDCLAHLRNMDIVLVIGREDPFLYNNLCLSSCLDQKGIPHVLHQWDSRAHRGSYWRKMVRLYL